MDIDWATIADGTGKVIVAGLLFGAGLPLLFSLGIRLWDIGSGGEHADGTVTAGKPAALYAAYAVFAVVAAAIVIGVLYITQKSIDHYLGIQLF
ncbi:hypothetical protein [Flexivirga meconopsidis]|uniref:hypothetical protein n=1 Tax=Flexivirga meconopsidis TaxID=2977121 RepID=UPI00223F103D|nr:hypothetical protein [Flexivirga meconopsidis]